MTSLSSSSILALLGLILAIGSAQLSSRIVRTKYGELSGVIVTLDRYLEGVEVFRGVPYASPPIGSLRFMPPVSGALWHGVKVADKFGPVCPQKLPELSDKMPKGRVEYLKRLLPYLRNQSEDCLYLNIYAPVQGNTFLHAFFLVTAAKWDILICHRNFKRRRFLNIPCVCDILVERKE